MKNIAPKYDINYFFCSKCKSETKHSSLNLCFKGNYNVNDNLNRLGYSFWIDINFGLRREWDLNGFISSDIWKKIFVRDFHSNLYYLFNVYIKVCSNCGNRIYFDSDSTEEYIELTNQNMFDCDIDGPSEFFDEELAKIYNEARNIYKISPRSAVALIRYILEQMLVENFPEVKNAKSLSDMLNSDIVKKKIGNNLVNVGNNIRSIANKSIHTNEIDMQEVNINMPEIFKWINDIANVIYNDYSIESKKSTEIKDKITK